MNKNEVSSCLFNADKMKVNMWFSFQGVPKMKTKIRQLSGDGVHYYVYNRENPAYRKKDNYFDEAHLMQKAAIEYTGELIIYLNDLIENEINIDN